MLEVVPRGQILVEVGRGPDKFSLNHCGSCSSSFACKGAALSLSGHKVAVGLFCTWKALAFRGSRSGWFFNRVMTFLCEGIYLIFFLDLRGGQSDEKHKLI